MPDPRCAILTDTVLHYRLAKSDRRTEFLNYLAKENLESWDCAVTICELVAKLDEERSLRMAGLQFSKEATSRCLPSPDVYVPYWINGLTGGAGVEAVRWEEARDELLANPTSEREKAIIQICRDILDPANLFVSDISGETKNLEQVLREAFPELDNKYKGRMSKTEVEREFDNISKDSDLKTQLARSLLSWLGASETQILDLTLRGPLLGIGRIRLLVNYYVLLWRDYLTGKKLDENDREDFLLLAYAPAVKRILTADKKFAKRAIEASIGTSFEDLVWYVDEPFRVTQSLDSKTV